MIALDRIDGRAAGRGGLEGLRRRRPSPRQFADGLDHTFQAIRLMKEPTAGNWPGLHMGVTRCIDDRQPRVGISAVLSDVPSIDLAGKADIRE
jgi:hypothetical protein